MKMKPLTPILLAVAVAIGVGPPAASAQTPLGTQFTYQGQLKDGGVPFPGPSATMTFELHDALTLGMSKGIVGPIVVPVTDGLFTATLNYGADVFNGDARWLEITVDGVMLTPRQEITVTPYALQTRGIFVDAAENVGIGTVAPLNTLHVVKGINNEYIARIQNLGGDGQGLLIRASDGVGLEPLLRVDANGSPRLVVTANGNVGIRQEPTAEALDVNGTIRANSEIESTGGGFRFPDGTVQMTAAGGGGGANTLDQAYDQGGAGAGRVITADAGPVEVAGLDGLVVTGTITSGSSITIDGTAGSERIVSTDALELHTSQGRNLRLEPAGPTVFNEVGPNIIGGLTDNSVTAGAIAATIAGGGLDASGVPFPNRVTDDYGTVGGGADNVAGDDLGTTDDARSATVGGGTSNTASGVASTVGGGSGNTASGEDTTVGGGRLNNVSGFDSTVAGGQTNTASGGISTIGGGQTNTASGLLSTVGGGFNNTPSGESSTVSGGESNSASGDWATVPGGILNAAGGDFSFAGGRRAVVRDAAASGDADGDEGSFVWADSNPFVFPSATDANITPGPNQFLARTTGGAVFVTAIDGVSGDSTATVELSTAGDLLASGTLQSGNSIVIDGTAGSENIDSSGDLDLRTSGTSRLFIDDAMGNVGIGTTTPGNMLDVAGGAAFQGDHLYVRNPASPPNSQTWGIVINSSDGQLNLGQATDTPPSVGSLTSSSFEIEAGAPSGSLHVDNNGNVGIGTNAPAGKLSIQHIGGSDTTKMLVISEDDNPEFFFESGFAGTGPTGNEIKLKTSFCSNPMTWRGDGNVGIGTTTPDDNLHVSAPGAGIHVEDTGAAEAEVYLGEGGDSGFRIAYLSANNDLSFIPRILGVDQPAALSIARATGNIGIPATLSVAKLNINNDTGDAVVIRGDSAQVAFKDVIGAQTMLVQADADGLAGEQLATLSMTNLTGNLITMFGHAFFGSCFEMSKFNNITTVQIFADATGSPNSGALIALKDGLGATTITLSGTTGRTTTKVLEITGADLAEKFPVSEEVKPGMVMEIDPDHPGELRIARGAYNRRVAGVVSGANDLSAGVILGNLPGQEDAPPIAMSGRVWAMCDATNGPIAPGDLLTTSDTPGHAMKVTDYTKAPGAVIGKAMSSLESGQRLVLVLVSLQ